MACVDTAVYSGVRAVEIVYKAFRGGSRAYQDRLQLLLYSVYGCAGGCRPGDADLQFDLKSRCFWRSLRFVAAVVAVAMDKKCGVLFVAH